MREYVPVFLHLYGLRPEDLTFDEWQGCKGFADDWVKRQNEGGM